MRIAITYNADTHLKPHLNEFERLGEDEVAESARDVHAALTGAHHSALFPVGDDIAGSLLAIRAFAPDVVFNLCEGVLGRTRWEAHFVLALDLLGIPYCGCDAVSIALTQDKGFVKQFLRRIGVPTPDGFAVAEGRPEDRLRRDVEALLAGADSGRVIVKPVCEDGGIGVETASVVTDADDALDRCRAVWSRYRQPALVEAFLDGAEYNLALYAGPHGLVTLPPGQIVFAPTLLPEQRVVGWRAKWDTGSIEDLTTQSQIVRNMSPALHAEIDGVCRRAAMMIGIHGYCRFDLRQGPDGRIHVLDINANPDIGPGSGFRKALAAADIRFEDFLEELLVTRRRGRREPWRSAA
jgi:D-alanine-D-alanine ligase